MTLHDIIVNLKDNPLNRERKKIKTIIQVTLYPKSGLTQRKKYLCK